jgi:hypothetical protein
VSVDTAIAPLAGASIAAALQGGALFSELACLLSGEEIVFRRDGVSPVCSLTAAERGPLQAKPGVQGVRREGALRTASGREVARVTSVYLQYRIDDEAAVRALQMTGEPLGVVLARLGATRQSLGAMAVTDGDIAVRSRGLLLIGGVPVALAEERVLRSFAIAP